jgi:hypothetical protein
MREEQGNLIVETTTDLQPYDVIAIEWWKPGVVRLHLCTRKAPHAFYFAYYELPGFPKAASTDDKMSTQAKEGLYYAFEVYRARRLLGRPKTWEECLDEALVVYDDLSEPSLPKENAPNSHENAPRSPAKAGV